MEESNLPICEDFGIIKWMLITICEDFGVIKWMLITICEDFGVIKWMLTICEDFGVIKWMLITICEDFGVIKWILITNCEDFGVIKWMLITIVLTIIKYLPKFLIFHSFLILIMHNIYFPKISTAVGCYWIKKYDHRSSNKNAN